MKHLLSFILFTLNLTLQSQVNNLDFLKTNPRNGYLSLMETIEWIEKEFKRSVPTDHSFKIEPVDTNYSNLFCTGNFPIFNLKEGTFTFTTNNQGYSMSGKAGYWRYSSTITVLVSNIDPDNIEIKEDSFKSLG